MSGEGGAAELVDVVGEGLEPDLVDVVAADGEAVACERQRGGTADPSGGARDEDGPLRGGHFSGIPASMKSSAMYIRLATSFGRSSTAIKPPASAP